MPNYALYKAAFEALSAFRIGPAVRRLSRSKGVIFTLHRVLPEPPAKFSPNAILQVTPDFLGTLIHAARDKGFDIVSLDEALRRIQSEKPEKPFVVLTFDDGYRDNLVHALPILRRNDAPFTLYVPTALVDGEGEVWWQALEDIIAANETVRLADASGTRSISVEHLHEKRELYGRLYEHYRQIPESQRVSELYDLAERNGFDLKAHCRSLIMDWTELRSFADEPLCTIGAHTARHYELAKLSDAEMREEIEISARALEQAFGRRPRHFSYPIGSRKAAGKREFSAAQQLGFETAVTTRPGAIYGEHAGFLHALPRISLNGLFQNERYLDIFLTGAVFSVANKFRKVDAD